MKTSHKVKHMLKYSKLNTKEKVILTLSQL